MTIVYFIRHSKPLKSNNEFNNDDLQLINEKEILSIEGEKLAKETSLKFQNIDVVYSSSYVRAMSTAKYIADRNNLNINIVSDFGERKFGVNSWDELPKDFAIKQFEDENYKIKNGESLKEVKNRMYNSLIKVLNENANKNICIVSHSTAMTALFKTWCEIKVNDGYYFKGNKFIDTKWDFCTSFKLEFDSDNKLINIYKI